MVIRIRNGSTRTRCELACAGGGDVGGGIVEVEEDAGGASSVIGRGREGGEAGDEEVGEGRAGTGGNDWRGKSEGEEGEEGGRKEMHVLVGDAGLRLGGVEEKLLDVWVKRCGVDQAWRWGWTDII